MPIDNIYVALLLRVREDVTKLVNRILAVRKDEAIEATAVYIRRNEAGRWHAYTEIPGLTSDSANGYDSEMEALCSLLERAAKVAEAEGAIQPLHLLEQVGVDEDEVRVLREHLPLLAQLAANTRVLAADRAALARLVRETLGGLDAAFSALDDVGALDFEAEQHAIEALLAAKGEPDA